MILHLITDVLRNSLLITGLVITMMIMIEFINVQSKGGWLSRLKGSKPRQVILAAILGSIPGCIGGFAAVSLYSHRLISFGALVAMMIASSGDEAFVMLAMIPKTALILFIILFLLAICTGFIVDKIFKKEFTNLGCNDEYHIHDHIEKKSPSILKPSSYRTLKNPGKKRVIIMIGISLFIAAIFSGILEHDHNHDGHDHVTHSHEHNTTANSHDLNTTDHSHEHSATDHLHNHESGDIADDCVCLHHDESKYNEEHTEIPEHSGFYFNFLSERWLNIVFAILSIITLLFITTADKHFIEEHIWDHVIKHHLLPIFLWTFGALLVIQLGLQFFDIDQWIRSNTLFMILLASLIGLIPESGPHLIFVTLFAGGYIPFSVLLASSISQDGHAALPLLAESKKAFIYSKLIGLILALIVGYTTHFIF